MQRKRSMKIIIRLNLTLAFLMGVMIGLKQQANHDERDLDTLTALLAAVGVKR